jgi:hypothetical protein
MMGFRRGDGLDERAGPNSLAIVMILLSDSSATTTKVAAIVVKNTRTAASLISAQPVTHERHRLHGPQTRRPSRGRWDLHRP